MNEFDLFKKELEHEREKHKLECKKLKKKASNPTCNNVDYCIWDNGKCREKKNNETKLSDIN